MSALYPDTVGVELIRRYSHDLASLADAGPLDRAVPTCGDWSLADLIWHVMEVQDFWAFIIASRPAGPDNYVQPQRPADAELAGGLRNAADRLAAALADADATDEAWSWAEEQTVAFTLRRQTHEALIHYTDGLVALDRPLPTVDPRLAADGVDEIVHIMLCGDPYWTEFERAGQIVQLTTTDTEDQWAMAFGRLTGVSPSTGEAIDITSVEVATGEPPDVEVSGTAVDLNLWLWGRGPDSAFTISGPTEAVAKLRDLVTTATQ